MLRRPLVFLGALVAAGAFAVPAFAIRVHVRVEGATRTIFGAAEPRHTPFIGNVPATDGSTVEIRRPTVLGALERASRRGEFSYRLTMASLGPYVDRIGRYTAGGLRGWVYKVNGVAGEVGANNKVLKDGDRVLWYFANFSKGSPLTLHLVRTSGGCYRAITRNDAGTARPARDVVFRLDIRVIRSESGRICPPEHWHRLRAAKRGTIRSELERPA